MCNCVPSSALTTHTLFQNQKLIRTSSSTTLSPPNLITRNHFANAGFLHFLIPSNTSNSCTSRIKVSSSSSSNKKPENYELGFNEIGEIETPKKEFGVNEDHQSFDFFELKSDLSNEKENIEITENEEEALKEGGKIVRRKGRQVVRRSNMLAKQVISVQSALSLGFVSQLWVDTCAWVVLVVEVRPSMLSGEMERFLLEDVCQIGDVVLVEDESVLEEDIKMLGLDTLVGYNVVTPSRRSVGKVRGFTFNINSGTVELLELDSFGISVIPSSLVSTYALFVEDVIDVESDTVVVQETAASRMQRLTKGFWDTPNKETFKDPFEEYTDLDHERRPIQSTSRRKRQKSTSTIREPEDDLQLPMDYL